MLAAPNAQVIDEFYEVLSQKMTPQEILDFKASPEAQARAHELMDKNNAGTITPIEAIELERIVQFEQFFGVLKAKALVSLSQE